MSPRAPPGWVPGHGETIDIGGESTVKDIYQQALKSFETGAPVPKSTAYVGPDGGWGEVSSQSQYYQTSEDMSILQRCSEQLFARCEEKGTIWELGPGDFHKSRWLLNKLCDRRVGRGNAIFYPILYLITDFSPSLERDVANLAGDYSADTIHIVGLRGSDEDGLKYFQRHKIPPCLLLNLGSMFFNKSPNEVSPYLARWKPFFEQGHALWASQDGYESKDQRKIEAAYGPPARKFVCDNFRSVVSISAGAEVIHANEWEPFNSFEDHPQPHHIIGLEAKSTVKQDMFEYTKGYRLPLFKSFKYGPDFIESVCREHGLAINNVFQINGSKMYHYYVIAMDPKGIRE
ncbi:DUF323 domain-containing protein [Fusarium coicis]|nr:DUF323 domain-containing protein [Fusarium coicis]